MQKIKAKGRFKRLSGNGWTDRRTEAIALLPCLRGHRSVIINVAYNE